MIDEKLIREQLDNTLDSIDLEGVGVKYEGKVRDNFTDEEKGIRIIVSSDRLSAFDRVITQIPFKGQLLNQMSIFWFEKTKNIADNHIIASWDGRRWLGEITAHHPRQGKVICFQVIETIG